MPRDDIDTDRITPARFLKSITFEGIEKALFCDERENTPDHPVDNPAHEGANMMFVGKNFGSGSSREHAPQALKRFGIEVLIGVSFAEIFAGNCFAIGVPLGVAAAEDVNELIKQAQEEPETRFIVDIRNSTVSYRRSRDSHRHPGDAQGCLFSRHVGHAREFEKQFATGRGGGRTPAIRHEFR